MGLILVYIKTYIFIKIAKTMMLFKINEVFHFIIRYISMVAFLCNFMPIYICSFMHTHILVLNKTYE